MVVNHGVSLGEVSSLIGYIMPAFLELTFPMAVLLGVLMGFGRMSGDREIIAARACGISLYRLACRCSGSRWWSGRCRAGWRFRCGHGPTSNLRDRLYRADADASTAGLKEKVFSRNFPGLVLYVDHISSTTRSCTV